MDPTIIVDEADTLLVHNEPLRAGINSGWTRGSGVLRCAGADKTPHLFPTFCPKVIGMKGRKLPDTTMSRCIIIELKRKKPSDRVDHFHHLDDPELANLRRQAQRWTMDNVATLKTAVPELARLRFANRLGDNWRLMLAIADLAGGEWPDQARQAATAVAKITDALSVGVKLLADIMDIFASKAVRRIPSAELAEALVEIERAPMGGLERRQVSSITWKMVLPFSWHRSASRRATYE